MLRKKELNYSLDNFHKAYMAQRGTCKTQKHEQESNSSIVWPFQLYLTSKMMLFLYTFSHQPARVRSSLHQTLCSSCTNTQSPLMSLSSPLWLSPLRQPVSAAPHSDVSTLHCSSSRAASLPTPCGCTPHSTSAPNHHAKPHLPCMEASP